MAFHAEWDAAHLDRTYSLVERDKTHLPLSFGRWVMNVAMVTCF